MTSPLPPNALRFRTSSRARSRLRWVVLGLAAALIFDVLVAPWLASFATDWLWFREIHFESVFLTSLVAHTVLFVSSADSSRSGSYMRISVGASRSRRRARRRSCIASGEAIDRGLGSLVPKLLLARRAVRRVRHRSRRGSAQWMTVLMAIHGCARRRHRPRCSDATSASICFGFPRSPRRLSTLVVLTMLSLVGVVTAVCHARRASCCRRRASVEPAAARHVGALLALLFLLFAAQLWIVDSSALLYSTTGPLAGASYADVHVSLPGIRLSAVAALLAAGLVVYGVFRQKLVWFAALAIGGVRRRRRRVSRSRARWPSRSSSSRRTSWRASGRTSSSTSPRRAARGGSTASPRATSRATCS